MGDRNKLVNHNTSLELAKKRRNEMRKTLTPKEIL